MTAVLILFVTSCGEQPVDPREKAEFRKVKDALTVAGQDDIQRTALVMDAARQGFPVIVSYLLDAGVPANAREEASGQTALHAAAENGHANVVERLAKGGADVNSRDANGATSLVLAAAASQCAVIPALLDAGADINTADDSGRTPLHISAEKGDTDPLKVFTQRGADVNARTKRGETPLFLAAKAGHRDIVELLLAGGSDPNSPDNPGVAPLSAAIQAKRSDLAELLLQHGADPNAFDDAGQPLLHLALRQKDRPLVELLADHGADMNLAARDGQTALTLAISENDTDLALLTIQRGANSNLPADYQHAPLTVAKRAGNRTIQAILEEHGAVAAEPFPLRSSAFTPERLKRPENLAYLAPAADWPQPFHKIGVVCAGVHIADQSPTDSIRVPSIETGEVQAREWWTTTLPAPANEAFTQVLQQLTKQRLEEDGFAATPVEFKEETNIAGLSEGRKDIDGFLAISLNVSIELIQDNCDIVRIIAKTDFVLFAPNGVVLAAGAGNKGKVIESTGYEKTVQGLQIMTNVSYRMVDVILSAASSVVDILDQRLVAVLQAAWMTDDVEARMNEIEAAERPLKIVTGERGNKRQRMVWDNSKWGSAALLTVTNAGEDPVLLLVNGPVARRVVAQPNCAPTLLTPPGTYDIAVVPLGDGKPCVSRNVQLAKGERYRFPWNRDIATGVQPEADADTPDREAIKGLWRAVAIEFQGATVPKERIKNEKLTVRFDEDKAYFEGGLVPLKQNEYTYSLGASTTWKTIDLGERETGFGYAIYELTGDTLLLCLGEGRYPTDFSTGDLGGFFMCVLEREKSPLT